MLMLVVCLALVWPGVCLKSHPNILVVPPPLLRTPIPCPTPFEFLQRIHPDVGSTILQVQTHSEPGLVWVFPHNVRYSQNSITGQLYINDMIIGFELFGNAEIPPIDIVLMSDGMFTSLDNRRVYAARQVEMVLVAKMHHENCLLDEKQRKRFSGATTWGEAVKNRIGNQKTNWMHKYPNGCSSDPDVKERSSN